MKLELCVDLHGQALAVMTLEIEVNVMPGKGNLVLTGKLGDVMKESAQTGISYIRSISGQYDVKPEFFQENDIHIHIPEGAVPKDGPSAGITMALAMLSAITNHPVRADIAMTGEITLRGQRASNRRSQGKTAGSKECRNAYCMRSKRKRKRSQRDFRRNYRRNGNTSGGTYGSGNKGCFCIRQPLLLHCKSKCALFYRRKEVPYGNKKCKSGDRVWNYEYNSGQYA